MNDLAHRIIASYRSKLVKMAGRSGPVGFSAIELAIQQAVAEETTADSASAAYDCSICGNGPTVAAAGHRLCDEHLEDFTKWAAAKDTEVPGPPMQREEPPPYPVARDEGDLVHTSSQSDKTDVGGGSLARSPSPASVPGQSPAPSDGELFDIAVSALNQSKVLRTSSFEQVGAIFKALADAGYVLTDDGPSHDWLPLAVAAAAQLGKHSACRCTNCRLAHSDLAELAEDSNVSDVT